MKTERDIIFTEQALFAEWIGFHPAKVVDFNVFWTYLFEEEKVSTIAYRLKFFKKKSRGTNLFLWMDLLEEKFIIYLFLFKELSLKEIIQTGKWKEDFVLMTMRMHLGAPLKEKLSFRSSLDPLFFYKRSDWEKWLGSPIRELSTTSTEKFILDEQVFSSPYFKKWTYPILMSQKVKKAKGSNLKKILKGKFTFSYQFKFVREVLFFLLLSVGIISSLKWGNKMLQLSLSRKITFLDTDDTWTTQKNSFREENVAIDPSEMATFGSMQEVQQLPKKISNKERFSPETSVSEVAVNLIPKNLLQVKKEKSLYAESDKLVLHHSARGKKKSYRVLVNSADLQDFTTQIGPLIKSSQVTQAEQVELGKKLPGGLYYNLFIADEKISSFLQSLNEIAETSIYENETETVIPRGSGHLVIYVKEI
ncbi:MAG: hypothetical protein KBD63_03505 [Bacteriovoracaceae bacterium]|nr:hypothetical protein [Bacteriovoracaceae bacterium]